MVRLKRYPDGKFYDSDEDYYRENKNLFKNGGSFNGGGAGGRFDSEPDDEPRKRENQESYSQSEARDNANDYYYQQKGKESEDRISKMAENRTSNPGEDLPEIERRQQQEEDMPVREKTKRRDRTRKGFRNFFNR